MSVCLDQIILSLQRNSSLFKEKRNLFLWIKKSLFINGHEQRNSLYTAVFTRDTREILLHMDKKFSLDREIVQEILFG